MKNFFLIITAVFAFNIASAQSDINTLVLRAKIKLNTVNDYTASGRMKTNVAFLKVPVASITVYYKKPNKLKVKSERGISFIPKGAVNINMSNLATTDKFTIIDAGTEVINGRKLRVAKMLPDDDNSDIVLSTIYVDETSALIYKAKTTTRENGTYELLMTYGKYADWALPDKILFSFNTKDYKLPKGVTFDFDSGEKASTAEKVKNKKGSAEISFSNYVINKGVADSNFK